MLSEITPFVFRLTADPKDPASELRQAELALRACGWWTEAGLTEAWPLTTAEVAVLLRDAGKFDIDQAGLEDLIERRMLQAPAVDEADEFEWSAFDVLLAAHELEGRQQWREAPCPHDVKKHETRLRVEAARLCGILPELVVGPNGERLDLRALLVAMSRCDDREGRCKLLSLLTATLEVEHGIRI